MTNKVYKTAQGKVVDLGALILQNEKVRAVGNMNVNARGDIVDSANKVIETKNRLVQKQYRQTTNVSADRAIHTSNTNARRAEKVAPKPKRSRRDVVEAEAEPIVPVEEQPVEPESMDAIEPLAAPPKQAIPPGGLAAAIARSKLIKQEKEKTRQELARASGLKKF